LSQLLIKIARKPVQIEVSAVPVLFELLGFLLKAAVSYHLSPVGSGIVAGNCSTGGLGCRTSPHFIPHSAVRFSISNRQFPSPSALRLQ